MRNHTLTLFLTFALAACQRTTPPETPEPAPAPPSEAPPPAPEPVQAKTATVDLESRSDSTVTGALRLVPMGDGVHVTGDVRGLAPGSTHGFHVHETGDCSAPDASSAGGHFNPAGSPHGRMGAEPHHAGDMDNITANEAGVATVDQHVSGVTLGDGGPDDIAGRAIVVHAAPDDYTSQPAGNAGARVACGVIRLAQ